MNGEYILEGHTPVPCDHILEWAKWMECKRHNSRVAETMIGDVYVSTVFLGLDHDFSEKEHVPILFETLVFGGPLDQEMDRYCTWDEAVAGHNAMVERVKKGKIEP